MKYSLSLYTSDYRGEREEYSDRLCDRTEFEAVVGGLLLRYGKAKDHVDEIEFTGAYQAAHGGMEPYGARLTIDLVDDGL